MLGIGSGYVGDLGPMLVRCWAVYVENIFRDNFLRFFPPLQAKTVEKPTFFNIRQGAILRRRRARNPVKNDVFEHKEQNPL